MLWGLFYFPIRNHCTEEEKMYTANCAEEKNISHFNCKEHIVCIKCTCLQQETVFNIFCLSNDLNFKKIVSSFAIQCTFGPSVTSFSWLVLYYTWKQTYGIILCWCEFSFFPRPQYVWFIGNRVMSCANNELHCKFNSESKLHCVNRLVFVCTEKIILQKWDAWVT